MTGPILTNAQLRAQVRTQIQVKPLRPIRDTPIPSNRLRLRPGLISLSAAIMAHPARREHVERLQAKLDREVVVAWDELQDRWDTGRRAMLAADPDCTHHVVIQDDVLIPNDLLAGIERGLAYIPSDAPMVGFVGRLRPEHDKVQDTVAIANQKKASWITMGKINWGPLVVVPTAHVCAMVAYGDPLVDILNYDTRLSRYWEDLGRLVWYCWPSLVDHADGPSLVPGRTGVDRHKHYPSRVAHKFCGQDVSALELDWTGPIVRHR